MPQVAVVDVQDELGSVVAKRLVPEIGRDPPLIVDGLQATRSASLLQSEQ